jgi:uncharacterized protein with HEPN domain
MLDAAQKAISIAEGTSRSELTENEVSALTITKLLEIIGEAARRVSVELRTAHPEVEWKKISGARDRLIQGYDAVDFDIVWTICVDDMPLLVRHLNAILTSGTEQ